MPRWHRPLPLHPQRKSWLFSFAGALTLPVPPIFSLYPSCEFPMTKTEYAETLKGPRWQEMRKEVLHNTPYCTKCDLPRWLAAIAYDQDLHVHHVSYGNRGKSSEINDLTPLCRRCHDIETFGRSEFKEPKSAICGICRTKHWNPYEDRCPNCLAFTVGTEAAYAALQCFHEDFGPFPMWAATLRYGIKYAGDYAAQREAVGVALEVIVDVGQQIKFAQKYPNGISDDDIAPIVEVQPEGTSVAS